MLAINTWPFLEDLFHIHLYWWVGGCMLPTQLYGTELEDILKSDTHVSLFGISNVWSIYGISVLSGDEIFSFCYSYTSVFHIFILFFHPTYDYVQHGMVNLIRNCCSMFNLKIEKFLPGTWKFQCILIFIYLF